MPSPGFPPLPCIHKACRGRRQPTQCRTLDDVVAVVASAVGASLGGRVTDPVALVGKALAKLGRVLILNNVDQMTAAAAALMVRWPGQTPAQAWAAVFAATRGGRRPVDPKVFSARAQPGAA
jgi:hypothetical protein